ncbi:hypothetical protein ARMSODRAFT_546567 [Armillaria solidipes]|uniref:Uncharacterized protein n=1 Tax=Armillaria solidipes TaxID=1076256 RepID=A0A2H3B878_9AGAR|nr:hypothetical protein ARMSODRAFT_546567 [Armillaria solidipes]
MKFTAQITILTAVLFTFVVATPMKGRQMASSGPSTTPSLTRRDNHGCSKKKTCDACIVVKGASGNLRGFSRTNGCVELSQANLQSSKLAQTKAECKAINSQQNAQQTSNDPNVDAAWNGMKTHVFGGGQKGTAGTHLTRHGKQRTLTPSFGLTKIPV